MGQLVSETLCSVLVTRLCSVPASGKLAHRWVSHPQCPVVCGTRASLLSLESVGPRVSLRKHLPCGRGAGTHSSRRALDPLTCRLPPAQRGVGDKHTAVGDWGRRHELFPARLMLLSFFRDCSAFPLWKPGGRTRVSPVHNRRHAEGLFERLCQVRAFRSPTFLRGFRPRRRGGGHPSIPPGILCRYLCPGPAPAEARMRGRSCFPGHGLPRTPSSPGAVWRGQALGGALSQQPPAGRMLADLSEGLRLLS